MIDCSTKLVTNFVQAQQMVQLGILSSLFNQDFSPSYAARDKKD